MTYLTIPNMITLTRLLVLTPLVIVMIVWNEPTFALGAMVLAGLSDAADGFIARMSKNYTDLGVWLDAAADKIMLGSSYVLLGYMQVIPLWVTGVVIGRDALIIAGVLLARFWGVPLKISPVFVSKVNSVVQILLIALILAVASWNKTIMYADNLSIVDAVTVIGNTLIEGVVWVMVITSVLSIVSYCRQWIKAILTPKKSA
ncbi:MAG: CDP-alcohol phosphatidyltransferase family protein [Parvularculales bacterium]